MSAPKPKTADELAAEGERLRRLSPDAHFVLYLYPSQVWMAVELQVPFLRYAGMNYADGQCPPTDPT